MGAMGFRVVSLSIGLAIGLIMVELALRSFGIGQAPGDLRGLHQARPDRPWIYGLRPNASLRMRGEGAVTYQVNADGFRDRIHVRPKPENRFRIIILGDSVTFGYGVEQEQTFAQELEAYLSSCDAEQTIDVLNLGVGGYNAYNESALLADIGGDYGPDLVLVQFCINDLNDPTRHFDTHTRLELGELPEQAFPNPEARIPPSQPPSAFAELCDGLRTCRLLRRTFASDMRAPGDDVAIAATFALRDDPKFEKEWSWLEARYREIAATSSDLGARFAVLAFPYQNQILRDGVENLQEQLRRIGDAGGWATLDLLPALREEAGREGESGALYLDLWHPNARGHEVAAAAIARGLIAEGLVPIARVDTCELLRRDASGSNPVAAKRDGRPGGPEGD